MPSGGVLSHLLLLVVLLAASIFGVSCSAHVAGDGGAGGGGAFAGGDPAAAGELPDMRALHLLRRTTGHLPALPCCYAINCNIPNRPFGFCSFTPKSCNCLECNL
ncbi:unnamed protein product [Spirodela intermedia]|uniref:DUF7866 domain-containing protein n=1 Tax=Spirodela intermedia TaxID=51605 RepID=A0A7I8IQ29_SPIIN|nr:unnamed protein product [Spirodela intermedia]CAA6659892.1 unnamed protein product [Spirodela intermedia]